MSDYIGSDTESIDELILHRNPKASKNRSRNDRERPPEQTQQAGANEDGRERDKSRAPRPLNPEAPRFPTPPNFRKAPRHPPGLPRRPEIYHPKVPSPMSNPGTRLRTPGPSISPTRRPEGRSVAANKRKEELKYWVRWCDEHANAAEEKIKEYTSAINAAREKFGGVNWEEMSEKGLELRLDQPGFRDQCQLRQGLQEYEEERVWLGQAKGRLCSELDKALIEDWEARREMEPTPKL
ncbi:uncharacterized protein IWZ02DRAFT_437399 [Phyllosticta citriasiana]|uniref:uncharacterized protein n=1 Tax=Phyllosticta citriasiana TaxID=595635 RepID=UPI0030FDE494